MSGRDEDFFTMTTRQAQPDGLLDRIDRAVIRAARATWRLLLDGFAAYGIAECAMFIDPNFSAPTPVRIDWPELATRYVYHAVDDNLPGDFDDIDALIRSLQTIEN